MQVRRLTKIVLSGKYLFIYALILSSELIHAVENDTVITLIKEPEETPEAANEKKPGNYSNIIPQDYNKWEIPVTKDKPYIESAVLIFIRSILDIDEKNEELLLDTDFTLGWKDPKIIDHLHQEFLSSYQSTSISDYVQTRDRTFDPEVLKQIWKPDVYIDELVSAELNQILTKPIALIYRQDEFSYNARTTLKLRCGMTFYYFPADTQTCTFYIRSYAFTAKQLDIIWGQDEDRSGVFCNDPSNPNFDIQVTSVGPERGKEFLYVRERFSLPKEGVYSALTFEIKARRKLSYHLVQTYLPSTLLILITWLCFLLPGDMVEARIAISMTTLLTLTAAFAAVRQISPEVSYTMAIDIWMVFCIFFVFIALLLFTSIYWMRRQIKVDEGGSVAGEEGDEGCCGWCSKETHHRLLYLIKHYAFGVFAVVFILFLISYWVWLLTASGYFEWELFPKYNANANESYTDEDNFYQYIKRDEPIHPRGQGSTTEYNFNFEI